MMSPLEMRQQADTLLGRETKGPSHMRFLSREGCLSVLEQLDTYMKSRGRTRLSIRSSWRGDVRWARNRATYASDWTNHSIGAAREMRGEMRTASIGTNQIDTKSLKSIAQWLDQTLRLGHGIESALSKPEDIRTPLVDHHYLNTAIWSDGTYGQSALDRNDVVVDLVTGAEAAGMLSAGYVAVRAMGTMHTADGLNLYAPQTFAECSLTVRDAKGTGSGWAGASSYDWNRFNARPLATVALDKCLRSRDPVAIEPGRYTVILEPQATLPLVQEMSKYLWLRLNENDSTWPYHSRFETVETHAVNGAERLGISKIGEKLIDERITISHDPMDPDLGVLPFTQFTGEPYAPMTFFDKGYLTALAYTRDDAIARWRKNTGAPLNGAFKMSGGTTSIEEMITSTKRGLIVTRLHQFLLLDRRSLLVTGLTRDGLWLIENGKISKPVRNFRFTESPLFVFNQVEQLGVPVPVFNPEVPSIVPPVKIRDFSFTSLVDSV